MRELKIRPVGKITSIDEVDPIQEQKAPVGKMVSIEDEVVISKGFDPLALSPQEKKMQEVGKIVDDLDFTGGYNEDEKKYLIDLAKNPAVDYTTWNDAKLTVGGEHLKQDGQQTYYFDDKTGLPIPLAQSERPPKGKEIESVWGSQASAEDDGVMTTIGKNLANTIPDFIQSFGTLFQLPYGLVTGKEAEWYRDLKNETESKKAKLSSASQQGFIDTSKVEDFEDLAKAENWTFTPENVAGNVSQLVSTVLQFMGGGAVAKGVGLGAKSIMAIEEATALRAELSIGTKALANMTTEEAIALGIEVSTGTKALAKLPYLASSYTNNLATSLDASENAGIEGRERYAIASLVTLPVAAVETLMGLTGKIAGNPAMKAERDAMIKGLVKGWKAEGGQMSKESLKELYDNTLVASSSVLGNMAKQTAGNMLGEASEEVLQNVIQKSSEQIYDSLYAENKEVGKGKYGTDMTSPQAFAEYLNDAIAGALGGGIGGLGVDKFKRAKAELQSQNAYDYIKKGTEAVQGLKASVARAMDRGTITPEQQKQAIFKIDTYQKYYDQVKDLNLDDKSNRRISDLVWSNENLKAQQNELSTNPESKIKGTIPHRRLLDTEAILEANSKEMSELMGGKIADQQTAVAVKVEEKIAEDKKAIGKEKAQVDKVIPLMEQVNEAVNEKDLDALLAQADKEGTTSPKFIDEVGKRRAQIKVVVPPIAPVEKVEAVVTAEHEAFSKFADSVIPKGKNFNHVRGAASANLDPEDRAYILEKHLAKTESKSISGVVELGEYSGDKRYERVDAITGKKVRVYYAINIGGKILKMASRHFGKHEQGQESFESEGLKGRKVSVALVKPTDTLDHINQHVFNYRIIENDKGKKVFQFSNGKEYSTVLSVSDDTGNHLGNLTIKGFGFEGSTQKVSESKLTNPERLFQIGPPIKATTYVAPTTVSGTEAKSDDVKNELLNNYKITEDDAENREIIEQLPDRDVVEQEPVIKNIESGGEAVESLTDEQKEAELKRIADIKKAIKKKFGGLNFLFKKAMSHDVTTAYDQVLQYFIGGGKINIQAIEALYGGTGREGQVKSEAKLRSTYIDMSPMKRSTDSPIERLSEDLYARQNVEGAIELDEFVNAVSGVVNDFNNRTEMATHLNSAFKEAGPNVDTSGSPERGLEQVSDLSEAEIKDAMSPITDKMAELEMAFENEGYEINLDYDYEISITNKKSGELVDETELPKKLLKSAGDYEKAVSKLGEFDDRIFKETLEASRSKIKGEDTDFDDVTPKIDKNKLDDDNFGISPYDGDVMPFQKDKGELDAETKEVRDKKIALLKKSLPGIKVVEDSSIGEDVAGQWDAKSKTISLNPNYNYADTSIHEFGHVLIDIMGGTESALIRKAVGQLKGSQLWNETKERYPELSEDMLAKEVLAEAIGREGVNVFDTKEGQSKFKNWLDGFFYAVKRLLGIEKNIAKSMANQLLSGKRISGTLIESESDIQKQKAKESKDIASSRPMSYKKWLSAQKFDEFTIKSEIADVKEDIEEATGEEKTLLEGRLELLQQSLDNKAIDYENYVEDHRAIVDFVVSKGDVSELSLEELYEIQSQIVKFDDFGKMKIYKDLLYNIAVKINQLETAELVSKHPDYNPEVEQSGDLTKKDIWAQGLSTIGAEFPVIQAFFKKYRTASGEMNREMSTIQQKAQELAKKVISEYQKKNGVAERLKNFTIGGGNKYFSFLAKDGVLVEKGSTEYNKLTPVQKELLDFMASQKANLDQYMDTDTNILLKSSAGFVETIQKSGIFQAYANYITNNHNLRNVKIQFKNPETGKTSEEYFGDAEAVLKEYAKKGHIAKVHAMALVTKYNFKARAGLGTTKHGKGKYFLRPDGKLVSMFGGEFKGDFTENYYETFMKYAQDAVFSKNMSPLMPTLTGIEMFYKSMGSNKENVSKFLEVVKKGKFLGETIESGLGEKADNALRVFRKWTSWRFIAFNLPANTWNILVGEYNQFRADGGPQYVKGKARLFKSMSIGKKNAKGYNILKNYYPDLVTDMNRIDPELHIGRFFDLLAFGGQKLGEGVIRGGAVLGKMSTEHYNWFNSQGKIIGKDADEIIKREAIVKKEIDKYISQTELVQGRYSDIEKRNFAHFELGQFFGQFKVWMPEWLSNRFANTYIDADGVKRTGSFYSLFTYGMRDFLRDARTKDFYTSNNPKHVAMRQQLRGMITTAVLLGAYLGASDDDDDKDMASQLDKALRNISGVYRMDNNQFLISQPAASMSTVVDLAKFLGAAISMEQIKSGKNEGDLKALNIAYNLLPGKNIIQIPVDMIKGE